MRVALLISGYLRTYRNNIPRIKSEIIDKFGHVDVYIHMTKNESQDDRYLNLTNFADEMEFVNKELKPVSLICEDNFKFARNPVLNNMWFKYHKLNNMKKANEAAFQVDYDMVIKFRPDVDLISDNAFTGDVSKDVVYIPLESVVDKDKLTKPDDPYVCDIFAYGNSAVMDRYFEIYHSLGDLSEKYGPVSETVLHHYLIDHGIRSELKHIEYSVLLSSCNVFAICGDSGAGKTTLGNILKRHFNSSFMLECDRYHKWERHDENWKKYTHLNPESNFLTKMSQDIFDLKIGKSIYQVDYDHKTGKFTDKEVIDPSDNIIVCGLNSLYSKNDYVYNLKIFIDTDTRLKTNWKIQRDVHERGHAMDAVLAQIESRKEDFDRYIYGQREKSDLVIQLYSNAPVEKTDIGPDDISLKLFIKYSFNIQEILNKFLELNVPFKLQKEAGFFELDFESYHKRDLWADPSVPQSYDFYDYIVFAIIKLKAP